MKMGKRKVKKLKIANEAPLKYSGTVTIQTIKKGKIISSVTQHNTGTAELFKFLLNCLAGKWIPRACPSFLTLGTADESGHITYVTDNVVEALEKTVHINDSPYVEFRFLVPFKNTSKGRSYNRLLVYSDLNYPSGININEEVRPDYSILLPLSTPEIIQEDEDKLIIWQLSLEN